jgi:hypothetical protein
MTVLQQEIPIPSRYCDHALFGGSGNLLLRIQVCAMIGGLPHLLFILPVIGV